VGRVGLKGGDDDVDCGSGDGGGGGNILWMKFISFVHGLQDLFEVGVKFEV
jgi:hypothetical protein